MRDVIALGEDKGVAPKPEFVGKVIPFKKPLLWKTFAEDKSGIEDKRANKPLFICPDKAKVIKVICKTGKEIATLGYFGTYSEGGHRYYSAYRGGSGHSASQIANLAIKASGSPWVWLTDGKKIWGPIHPAFRAGYFR